MPQISIHALKNLIIILGLKIFLNLQICSQIDNYFFFLFLGYMYFDNPYFQILTSAFAVNNAKDCYSITINDNFVMKLSQMYKC